MQTSTELFWLGFIGSLIAGLGTSVGALAVALIPRISERVEDALLSLAAGVMLAASFFSLLLPAIDSARQHSATPSLAAMTVIIGIMAGALLLYAIHHFTPHEHFIVGREGPDTTGLRRIWLFVIAITIHNFPEGMAVGIGFAAGGESNGTPLATGIWLQNIPEGLAVSTSLIALGYSRLQAFTFSSLTGLVEPIGGAIGAAAAWLAEPAMPWTLGFAAGAMLFVISGEIIPETHRGGYRTLATFSLLSGFVVMMFLDVTLA